MARKTLANLTLMNRAWSEAARPWPWRKFELRLPRGRFSRRRDLRRGRCRGRVRSVEESITSCCSGSQDRPLTTPDVEAEKKMKENHSVVPPLQLLSPPASHDPSPCPLRQKS